ncbi:MAPEG family protein [Synechococcus sp. CS-1325]|uniref:MAPEG family protein n=1 Tax=Synechococcus sp. CS-1325 TaxID=2847979 RepID=UPI000DB735AF|nr:MAPEG family protein [Synechococcus sp. CS-1325]MCT0200826.1 MAPEG family protein [Synechococcus sp. CS-1325]PZU98729.1 MAG: MAPEG family protein [Cyanobium sp.]
MLALLAVAIPSGNPAAPFAWSLVLSGAVVVLSLVPLAAGRSKADFTPGDLAAPRAMFERLPAWGKRASWAHQNSFEAFTLHAPACLLCLLAAPAVLAASPLAASPMAAVAAWLHPALRLAYIGAYVANIPPLRSLCWIGALLSTGLLYSEGLKALLRS